MSAATSYRLGEVAGYANDPSHQIPPPHYREDLEPGELAWLMVERPEDTKPLWTEIREVLGPGWYLGRTKDGTEVEFGAEHVFGIDGPRIQMGAWYDYLPGGKGRARPAPAAGPGPAPATPPKSAAWWEHLPGGPRGGGRGGPGVFDVWGRGAPAAGAEPVPPPGSASPKKSFWDFFRRKPKVTLEPIPPGERREAREIHSFRRLPGVTPKPPAPMEAQLRPQEAPRTPGQAIILPEVIQGFSVMPEGHSRAPDELFQVLAPPPGASAAPPAAGSMIVGPSSALPAQVDAFSVLEPGGPSFSPSYGPPAMPGAAPNPFEMISPEAAAAPFGMIVPGEPTPFDILEPEGEGPSKGLVVRPEQGVSSGSVFDILEPEPQPMTPYAEPTAAPPPGPTLFDAVAPEPPKAKRKKATKKKRGPDWEIPTREEWVKWIHDTFDLEDLWGHIRKERNSEYFLEEQLNEDDMGEPPLIPVQTWEDAWNFDQIMPFFGVPAEVWEPISDKMAQESEETGAADEAWELMQIDVLEPLENALEKAFKSIQPADLPGHFLLAHDDSYGTWGLCYYERIDPKTASKRQREIIEARDRAARETKELERRRKAEIKRIWGQMPKPEDLVPWIEEKFDLDAMFADITKSRRAKPWKQQIKEEGEAQLGLEIIANLGPNKRKDYEYEIASYFGIPPDLVTLYEDSESGQELWRDIFWPFFETLSEAFMMILPWANLPGTISVDEDQDDHLILQYIETAESED